MISPVRPTAVVERLHLRQRVLPVGAVDDQHHLVRCTRHRLVLRALDAFQLFHQMLLRRQAAGSVGNQHVDAARLCGGHRIENHRGRIAAALRDDLDLIARAPDRELFARRSAERVAGRQQHRLALARNHLASLPIEVVLPAPLTPAHHHDKRPTPARSRSCLRPGQQPSELVTQCAPHFVLRLQPLQLDAVRSASISCAAVATPTSAPINATSSSSRNSSSTTPPENSPTMLTRVLVRPRLESRQPAALRRSGRPGTYHRAMAKGRTKSESKGEKADPRDRPSKALGRRSIEQCNKAPRCNTPRPSGAPHRVRIIGGHWKRTPLPVADVRRFASDARPRARNAVQLDRAPMFRRSSDSSRRSICLPAPARWVSSLPRAVLRHVTLIENNRHLVDQLSRQRKLAADQIEIVAGDALTAAAAGRGFV